MVVRLNRLAIAAIAVAMPLVVAQRAIAQEVEVRIISPGYIDTVPEAVDDAFFSHDPDYYQNRGVGEQLDWMFGFGGRDLGFLENEIWRDGRAVSDITDELLFEQAHSTPIIRTADLPNPFNQSLQVIERIEPLEAVPLPPARSRVIVTPPSAPPAAVPALW
ncbi:MAG: hypothetical protein IGR76_04955 [Synechococcales cyanobacterium T60_A2020_003]|nr:hypothetical protein [Synechococcales cyanobacterium T60_A2020_003]